jgi:hypothetical protein
MARDAFDKRAGWGRRISGDLDHADLGEAAR